MPDPIFPEVITKEQIKLGVDLKPNTAAPITPYVGPKGPTTTAKPFVRTVPVQVVAPELILPTDNILAPRGATGTSSITRVPAGAINDVVERGAAARFGTKALQLGKSALPWIGKGISLGTGVIADVLLNAEPTVSGQQEADAIRQAEALRQQQDALPSLPPLNPAPITKTPTTEYNPFDVRPRQPSDSPVTQPSDRVVDSPQPVPFALPGTGGGVNLTRPILEELLKQRQDITKLQNDVTQIQNDVTQIQDEIKIFPPLIIGIPGAIAPMLSEIITFNEGGFTTTIDTITKIQTNTYIEIPKSPGTVVSVPVGGGGGGFVSIPVSGGGGLIGVPVGGGGGVTVPVGGGGLVSIPRSPEFIFSLPQAPTNIFTIPKNTGSFIAIPKDCENMIAIPQTCNNFVAIPIIGNFEECCEEIKEKLDKAFPRIEGSGDIVCGTDEEGNPITTPYQFSEYGLLGLRDQINITMQVIKQILDKVCNLQIEYPLVEGELNYSCQTGVDEEGNPIIETVEQIYTGLGFAGLQDQIAKLAAVNQAILTEVCELEENNKPECFPVLPDGRFEFFKITSQLTITFGENYPTQKGSLWHIHVPNPITGLNWCDYFDNLIINSGSRYNAVYARIYWQDNDTPTSAWFATQEDAEMVLSYLMSLSTSLPRNPVSPIRYTLNGISKRSREQPFSIRAVRAVESYFNPDSFEPTNVICHAPPKGGCNGS